METKRIVGMLLHGGANEQGLKMSAEDVLPESLYIIQSSNVNTLS